MGTSLGSVAASLREGQREGLAYQAIRGIRVDRDKLPRTVETWVLLTALTEAER
ncbi:MAG: hypothetical protein ABI895_32360 [Deltaproteobacteria bacterium]